MGGGGGLRVSVAEYLCKLQHPDCMERVKALSHRRATILVRVHQAAHHDVAVAHCLQLQVACTT